MSHDTWIHRIARALVRPLAGTALTPNHLTAARLATGLGAAALLALGSQPWTSAAAALFVFSMLLDRADGELARQSGRSSHRGHRFDLWTDGACDTAIILSLGFAQRGGVFGTWAIALGTLGAAAVAVIFWHVLEADRRLGADSVRFAATAGFDPDDAIIIVPVAVVAGLGDWIVAAAAVATPLVAAAIVLHLRRRLAAQRRGAPGA